MISTSFVPAGANTARFWHIGFPTVGKTVGIFCVFAGTAGGDRMRGDSTAFAGWRGYTVEVEGCEMMQWLQKQRRAVRDGIRSWRRRAALKSRDGAADTGADGSCRAAWQKAGVPGKRSAGQPGWLPTAEAAEDRSSAPLRRAQRGQQMIRLSILICGVLGALVLRAVCLPCVPGVAAERAFAAQTQTGCVVRFLIRAPGGGAATLYNALGQRQQRVHFDAHGQAAVAAAAGEYILCAGDAQVRFCIGGGAALRTLAGSGRTEGMILYFDAPEPAVI